VGFPNKYCGDSTIGTQRLKSQINTTNTIILWFYSVDMLQNPSFFQVLVGHHRLNDDVISLQYLKTTLPTAKALTINDFKTNTLNANSFQQAIGNLDIRAVS